MGLIDPGYEGPLSTTLVNFSSQEFTITIGSPFLRLCFNPIINPDSNSSPTRQRYNDYLVSKKRKATQYFGDYFLNPDQFLESIADKTYKKYRNTLIIAVSVATLFIAGATYFATYYAAGLSFSEMLWRDRLSAETSPAMKIREMEKRIEELENKLGSEN
jgi:hypothetical protein